MVFSRTNAFSQLQTNVDLTLNAVVSGARADSQVVAFASIQSLGVTLTGSVAVVTTTATNRLNSANALAAHRFDLLFELPCTHEASLRTFLEGTNWLRLFRPVIVNDNQNTVADPAAEEQRFYRLAAP